MKKPVAYLFCLFSLLAAYDIRHVDSHDTLVVEYTHHSHTLTDTLIGEEKFTIVHGPEKGRFLTKGAPFLPRTATVLALPNRATPQVISVDTIYRKIPLPAPVMPSRGNILRAQAQQSHPHPSSDTVGGDWFPRSLYDLDTPRTVQGQAEAVLRLHPYQYNHETQTLRVIDTLRVHITLDHSTAMRPLSSSPPSMAAHERSRQRRHINPLAAPPSSEEERDRMLVLAHPDHIPLLTEYVRWKNKRGLETIIHPYAEESPEEIREIFRTEYLTHGLTYAVIIGDWETIPSLMDTYYEPGEQPERVSEDPALGMFEEGSLYADIFVGRISVETEQELQTYLEKVLTYEKYPEEGADWYQSATGIGSREGRPADYRWIADSIHAPLAEYGFTTLDTIFELKNGTEDDLSTYINEGRSLINFMGHGDNRGFGFTSGFWYTAEHIDSLKNNHRLPWIIPLACNVGQFKGRTVVAEEWIRKEKGGAIAIVGSSPLMHWYPPQLAQVDMNRRIASGDDLSMGEIFYAGKATMLDHQGEAGKKTARTWIFFGDPSLPLFTAPPRAITPEYTPRFTQKDSRLTLSAPSGSRVTIYGEKNGILTTEIMKETETTLQFTPAIPEDSLFLTITGKNRLPYRGIIFPSDRSSLISTDENTSNSLSLTMADRHRLQGTVPQDGTYEIQLYTLRGERVLVQKQSLQAGAWELPLHEHSLAAQTYIVRLKGSGHHISRRIRIPSL
ncbi:C25 family cysteine peptidase [Chitinivibrio alkaliphilus]|uniref:Putative Gingipain R n=1 Tax=Chitinivibrio alkaliphilus ACht1 TaxID=1313304 RepID=U7D6S1_9BACT|nr:C25 family cysteine peptidase [Chitinivibrio alkaliphilus]ERP32214.1 putative Gingipain R [Chitinivibrio alkaliphilus ACht1]